MDLTDLLRIPGAVCIQVTKLEHSGAGLNATEALAALRAAHAEGRIGAGLDVTTGKPRELSADGIVDLYQTKWWALRLAVDAAVTVLKVDQIIMVRPYEHAWTEVLGWMAPSRRVVLLSSFVLLMRTALGA